MSGIEPEPSKIRTISLRGLAVRFAFGAVISVAAGLVGHYFGPLAGGVFLAFPAILPATLTLIQEKEEQRAPAAQDAKGATLGAVGMIVFAVCVWAAMTGLPAWLALTIATAAWALTALLLYRVTTPR
ncbi:DUF3147 family protein [Streptosporangium sp. NPDC000509]|uniref:DUF3147 family protein n=1 Tax=Streptosporangium sp. NPDC000509 TaxID=3366186 RepID=UPI0036CC36F8